MKLKLKKVKEGYYINPQKGVWYFISENASYWCSHSRKANGQLSERDFEHRLAEGARQINEHYNKFILPYKNGSMVKLDIT